MSKVKVPLFLAVICQSVTYELFLMVYLIWIKLMVKSSWVHCLLDTLTKEQNSVKDLGFWISNDWLWWFLWFRQRSWFWFLDSNYVWMIMIWMMQGQCASHGAELGAHVSWSRFFRDKKKQKNCIRGSFKDVLLILKTLTFKSGTSIRKSYRTFHT